MKWLHNNALLQLQSRHGRACPGHPRGSAEQNLQSSMRSRDVDGRDKPGHDARRLDRTAITSFHAGM
jgi:hypothetical protein